MAVFWQGPVKVTLETSRFPLGKWEEKDSQSVFQVGNVKTTLETCMVLLTSVIPIGSVKDKK